jgi:hypothetical protein
MCRAIVAIASAITIATLSGAYANVDRNVVADNGAVYHIYSVAVPYDPNEPIDVVVTDEDEQVTTIVLDCGSKHFKARVGFNATPWRTIPSRSVVAKIAQIACAPAKR